MNAKIKSMLAYIQNLQVVQAAYKSLTLDERYKDIIWKARQIQDDDSPDIEQEFMDRQRMLMTAHTEGFNIGLMHGRFLQGQIERTLLINEG